MNHYSQINPLWKDQTLGHSSSKIGSYGCKLCCLSMMNYTDPPTTNKMLLDGGAFTNDLIDDSKASVALGLKYDGRKLLGSIPNPTSPCIVEVDYSAQHPGTQQHFCVWLGFNNQIVDPIDGQVKTNPYHIVSWRLFHERPQTPQSTAKEQAISDITKYVTDKINQLP